MANETIPCKVCGKQFMPCFMDTSDPLNYRKVACSPECGAKYFEDYFAAMNANNAQEEAEVVEEIIEVEAEAECEPEEVKEEAEEVAEEDIKPKATKSAKK